MKVSEEKETVVEEEERMKCAGDAPFSFFVAELPLMLTVSPSLNVMVGSVGCIDPVLSERVKDVLPLYLDAMEYAEEMVVHAV